MRSNSRVFANPLKQLHGANNLAMSRRPPPIFSMPGANTEAFFKRAMTYAGAISDSGTRRVNAAAAKFRAAKLVPELSNLS